MIKQSFRKRKEVVIMFKKELVKGIFDIAKENNVQISVATSMLKSNIDAGKEIHKGANIDYAVISAVISDKDFAIAKSIAENNYNLIVKARENDDEEEFDKLFI